MAAAIIQGSKNLPPFQHRLETKLTLRSEERDTFHLRSYKHLF